MRTDGPSKTRSLEQTETKNIILDIEEAQGNSQKQLGDSWKASGHNNLPVEEEHNLIFVVTG